VKRARTALDRKSGFTLLETILSMGFLLVAAVGVSMALNAGVRATKRQYDDQLTMATAQTYVDRIVRQNFGNAGDPEPSKDDMDKLFDKDSQTGSITVHQVAKVTKSKGKCQFRPKPQTFPLDGDWSAIVDQDLNGDGNVDGKSEMSGDIFRIRVFKDDLILQTFRAKEVTL
jgi:type II secretory pathway pseudopilin PulG